MCCELDKLSTLSAVKRNGGHALNRAPPELKADKEFLLSVVDVAGVDALAEAADSVRADRDFMLAVASEGGDFLRYASDALRSDREFLLAAADRSWLALSFVAEPLKEDKELVLMAVTKRAHELESASPAMKADLDVVRMAVRRDGKLLWSAAEELQKSVDVVKDLLHESPESFRHLLILQVGALSGEACCCVVDPLARDFNFGGMLQKCVKRLDLSLDALAHGADSVKLLHAGRLLESSKDLEDLPRGVMVELQLIVQQQQRLVHG
mmetsp:Transcript_19505/g.45376  ORF Transcript_19505/g.45376 Transcript_19505/m.45376 type:complete len:267 (+) Transcript_19505:69-869(+)